jgi:hypothetical protein
MTTRWRNCVTPDPRASTAAMLRSARRRWRPRRPTRFGARRRPVQRMSSVLYSPIVDSASALSTESPREPIEVTAPASASRSCSGSKGTARVQGVVAAARPAWSPPWARSATAITTPSPGASCHPGMRAAAPPAVPHPDRGSGGGLRLPGRLLQPAPAALRARPAQPCRVRKEPPNPVRCRPALTRPPNRVNSRTTSDGHTGVRQSPITLPVMVISSFSIGS